MADFGLPSPLRVEYTIPADGWISWIGAYKPGAGSRNQTVAVSIATVRNLVTDGCTNQLPLDPPVGQSVDDLAAALTELAPFEVVEPPSDVRIYGYSGKHLVWTVPETHQFIDCDGGEVRSWIAPLLSYAFYDYAPSTRSRSSQSSKG